LFLTSLKVRGRVRPAALSGRACPTRCEVPPSHYPAPGQFFEASPPIAVREREIRNILFEFFTETLNTELANVADPGCLSRIPYPNFFHPGSHIQGKKSKSRSGSGIFLIRDEHPRSYFRKLINNFLS